MLYPYHNKKRSLFMDGLAFLQLANEVLGEVGAELRECAARLDRGGGADWWQRQEQLEREQQEDALALQHDRRA
ncbi:MAG: hypothetical protein F9K34_17665 [Albidovulum sp.]|uniref:hypothetical protein n=1 Tax=Albidovulum sp. TaxID=1872424 RepID=UPI001322C2E3|nr:hypothetical protein [Defluviimonas sp.]KAB2878647.1 MAG: hypothetical protein F9K34_17665 [Defluviimonas sp.]